MIALAQLWSGEIEYIGYTTSFVNERAITIHFSMENFHQRTDPRNQFKRQGQPRLISLHPGLYQQLKDGDFFSTESSRANRERTKMYRQLKELYDKGHYVIEPKAMQQLHSLSQSLGEHAGDLA